MTDETSLIDRAARIIDPFAFRDKVSPPMLARQRIAHNKASTILADAVAEREELIDELAAAHKQIDLFMTVASRPFDVTLSELRSGVIRRAALLARYGRSLP
jgi:hypothetical protein